MTYLESIMQACFGQTPTGWAKRVDKIDPSARGGYKFVSNGDAFISKKQENPPTGEEFMILACDGGEGKRVFGVAWQRKDGFIVGMGTFDENDLKSRGLSWDDEVIKAMDTHYPGGALPRAAGSSPVSSHSPRRGRSGGRRAKPAPKPEPPKPIPDPWIKPEQADNIYTEAEKQLHEIADESAIMATEIGAVNWMLLLRQCIVLTKWRNDQASNDAANEALENIETIIGAAREASSKKMFTAIAGFGGEQ